MEGELTLNREWKKEFSKRSLSRRKLRSVHDACGSTTHFVLQILYRDVRKPEHFAGQG